MSRTTEQTNHASRSTATADAGETFVDPATAEGQTDAAEERKPETLDDELNVLAERFPQVAELLRTSVKYLA